MQPPPECPFCGSNGHEVGEHRHLETEFRRFACATCAAEYWSPRRIDAAFYAAEEHGTYDRRRRGESFLRPRHHLFLESSRPGTLLDVGCGEGSFLLAAKQKQFVVTGVDLDPGNIAVTKSRGLTDALCGQLLDAELRLMPALADRCFDHVTAFEVLEHQSDPMPFLAAIRSLLSPGGMFTGSVPNRDRWLARTERRTSAGDLPPHHFLWFSKASLANALRLAGFESVVVSTVPETEAENYASYLENLLFGRWTRAAKKQFAANPSRPGTDSRRRTLRRLKNLPFQLLARGLPRVSPEQSRALYFRATSPTSK